MIDDRKSQRIPQTFVYTQPGMLVAKPLAGTQALAPGRAIHIFIKLAIQITLYALLLQTANRTARFATRLR